MTTRILRPLAIVPVLLVASTAACTGTTVAKLSVTVIQRHETNSIITADNEIFAFGGPCHPVPDQETLTFVGNGWAFDKPSLRLHSMYQDPVASSKIIAEPNGAAGGHLTAFVTCLKPFVPIGFNSGHRKGVVPSGTTVTFEAPCVTGVPVMGEFLIQSGSGYIETFHRTQHTWLLKARAVGGPMTIEVTALCESKRLVPSADQPYSGVVVPPGKSASTSVGCPAGSVLTNGGFDVPDGQGVIVTQNSPAAASDPSPGPAATWRVTGFNIDQIDHVLYARAVCMTVDAVDHPVATYQPSAPAASANGTS
jgi:hypothetical protein